MVIDKLLLVNLKRYPQDRRSIYVTFKHLGANHPDLTLPLITSLLKIHPYFDKQEEDIEDPAYLCKLILVLNAAQHCPSLPQLLDNHTQVILTSLSLVKTLNLILGSYWSILASY